VGSVHNLSSREEILFVSHDASRSGAPFVLLHFLKWFKENADTPFRILLRNGGQLEDEFAGLAPTAVFHRAQSTRDGVAGRVLRRVGLDHLATQRSNNRLKAEVDQSKVSMIYSNTITNGEVLELFKDFKGPVLSHVHELEFGIRFRMDPRRIKQTFEHSCHYIAGANAAKRNLVENHAIPPEKIDVVYECIPIDLHAISMASASYASVRGELNIPEDAFIVGGAGTTEWRKGPDIFIQVARTIAGRELSRSVHFVWVGGDHQGRRYEQLRHDVRHAGLDGRVHFVGARPDYLRFLAAFDVLALVSREDCFPLVMLEAALFSHPTVCFDGVGGASEFVENDCGSVVPFLDLESMGERILALFESPDLRSALGQRAAAKVRERHDVSIVGPQIVTILDRVLRANSALRKAPG